MTKRKESLISIIVLIIFVSVMFLLGQEQNKRIKNEWEKLHIKELTSIAEGTIVRLSLNHKKNNTHIVRYIVDGKSYQDGFNIRDAAKNSSTIGLKCNVVYLKEDPRISRAILNFDNIDWKRELSYKDCRSYLSKNDLKKYHVQDLDELKSIPPLHVDTLFTYDPESKEEGIYYKRYYLNYLKGVCTVDTILQNDHKTIITNYRVSNDSLKIISIEELPFEERKYRN